MFSADGFFGMFFKIPKNLHIYFLSCKKNFDEDYKIFRLTIYIQFYFEPWEITAVDIFTSVFSLFSDWSFQQIELVFQKLQPVSSKASQAFK